MGGSWKGRAARVALACAATLPLAPVPARASSAERSILQDDDQLIYSSRAHVAHTLDELRALGVEEVRVSVIWASVAPAPRSTRRPSFDAADPAAYPPGVWERYDTVLQLAHERGLEVNFDLTAPAPYWAATSRPPASGFRKTYSPDPAQFERFVTAVGRRYSGDYVAVPPRSAPPSGLLGLPLPFVRAPAPRLPELLPRVDSWSVWNEPNEGGWLTPQWRRLRGGRFLEASPVIYRRLVDAAWEALRTTGHGGDTILVGETAARGALGHGVGYSMRPMPFIRALYCVDRAHRPLRGPRARELACPTTGDPAAFPAEHPGLFAASGYAHHPYSFHAPPAVHMADPEVVTLADLPRLEHALDAIFATYRQPPPAGARTVPLYLTEYGYKTNPPNPYVEFSQAQQAVFLNQAEYMTFIDPRVAALAQFLLVDDRPKAGAAAGSRSYWSTFQTGLIGLDGSPKPAYVAYRMPIWLPHPRHGPRVTVWGQLRPADHHGLQTAAIEYRPRGGRTFALVRHVRTTSSEGFILAHVDLAVPGLLRLAWRDPDGGAVYRSRAAEVR